MFHSQEEGAAAQAGDDASFQLITHRGGKQHILVDDMYRSRVERYMYVAATATTAHRPHLTHPSKRPLHRVPRDDQAISGVRRPELEQLAGGARLHEPGRGEHDAGRALGDLLFPAAGLGYIGDVSGRELVKGGWDKEGKKRT